jgi:hypothetical protein
MSRVDKNALVDHARGWTQYLIRHTSCDDESHHILFPAEQIGDASFDDVLIGSERSPCRHWQRPVPDDTALSLPESWIPGLRRLEDGTCNMRL